MRHCLLQHRCSEDVSIPARFSFTLIPVNAGDQHFFMRSSLSSIEQSHMEPDNRASRSPFKNRHHSKPPPSSSLFMKANIRLFSLLRCHQILTGRALFKGEWNVCWARLRYVSFQAILITSSQSHVIKVSCGKSRILLRNMRVKLKDT